MSRNEFEKAIEENDIVANKARDELVAMASFLAHVLRDK